jgi:hypothetical protein
MMSGPISMTISHKDWYAKEKVLSTLHVCLI